MISKQKKNESIGVFINLKRMHFSFTWQCKHTTIWKLIDYYFYLLAFSQLRNSQCNNPDRFWLKSYKQIATIHTSSRSHHLNEQILLHFEFILSKIAKDPNYNSSHWVFSLCFPLSTEYKRAKVKLISHFWSSCFYFFSFKL